MYTDMKGNAPVWWQWALSGSLVVAGIVLTATGVGGVLGGVLISAGVNSVIGGYVNEMAGGSYTAGWVGGAVTGAFAGFGAGLGGTFLLNASNSVGTSVFVNLLKFGGASFGFGMTGSFAGSLTTSLIDQTPFNFNDSFNLSLLAGATTLLGGLGSTMSNVVFSSSQAPVYTGVGLGMVFLTEATSDTITTIPSFSDSIMNRNI